MFAPLSAALAFGAISCSGGREIGIRDGRVEAGSGFDRDVRPARSDFSPSRASLQRASPPRAFPSIATRISTSTG